MVSDIYKLHYNNDQSDNLNKQPEMDTTLLGTPATSSSSNILKPKEDILTESIVDSKNEPTVNPITDDFTDKPISEKETVIEDSIKVTQPNIQSVNINNNIEYKKEIKMSSEASQPKKAKVSFNELHQNFLKSHESNHCYKDKNEMTFYAKQLTANGYNIDNSDLTLMPCKEVHARYEKLMGAFSKYNDLSIDTILIDIKTIYDSPISEI